MEPTQPTTPEPIRLILEAFETATDFQELDKRGTNTARLILTDLNQVHEIKIYDQEVVLLIHNAFINHTCNVDKKTNEHLSYILQHQFKINTEHLSV